MKTIIVDGKEVFVDDEDYVNLLKHKWRLAKRKHTTYVITGSEGGGTFMHHLLIGKAAGLDVDHLDGNGCNNTKANLRHTTRSLNMHNGLKRRDNSSGFRGVSWHHCGKWMAYINVDGKRTILGYFVTPEQANIELVNYRKQNNL